MLLAFSKRAVISVIAAAIIMIMEYIGRINADNKSSIPGAFAFIITAVVIFNLLSYGYVILKKSMDIYKEHLSYIYGTVSEKYSRQKNYILFETESNCCTTAVAVQNADDFSSMAVGDSVLIVKSIPYGSEVYEVYLKI